MNQALPAICAAAVIAMSSAFFGAVVARIGWAQDLKQSQRLRQIWNETEGHIRRQIEAQQRIIEAKKRTIEILNKATPDGR